MKLPTIDRKGDDWVEWVRERAFVLIIRRVRGGREWRGPGRAQVGGGGGGGGG